MPRDKVEVVDSTGCSNLLSIPSRNDPRPSNVTSLGSATSSFSSAVHGSFAGLVICVTGLSKEARQQVMAATKRLGGQYSSSLNPQCTHLVVQSFGGRKFQHAMKHGLKNGLYVVTLGWFIDSVRKNTRLRESLYGIASIKENNLPLRDLNPHTGYANPGTSCIPAKLVEENRLSTLTQDSYSNTSSCKESRRNKVPFFSNERIYIDSNISVELKGKVLDALTTEGAKILEHWFVGCQASHVVCEGPHIQRYVGYADTLVTPLWIVKTVKSRHLHRLVHLSSDLARQVAAHLGNAQDTETGSLAQCEVSRTSRKGKDTLEDRQKEVDLAKAGVRNRRHLRMQAPLRPLTPGSLLDSICWSISEPTSLAGIFTNCSETDTTNEHQASALFDTQTEGRDSQISFNNSSRPLKESEKVEIIFKCHFLTILFPIDRFGELGPSSKTFFSEGGFTCVHVLDAIYNFYQENMSAGEMAVAIHTDSRHSDRLRSVYASKESINNGFVSFKRIDFLGSRRYFEILKRVNGENNNNVYELVIRA